MSDVRSVGLGIFREACIDPFTDPPKGGAIELAKRVCGRDIIYQARIREEGGIHTIGGKPRIVHRIGLSTARANFLIGRLLGRMFLESSDWWLALPREEQSRTEFELGAFLVAPPEAFSATFSRVGVDLRTLAREFSISETAAAIRIGEISTTSSVVATSAKIYRRGKLLAWASDEDVRELARKRNPRSV